MIIIAHRGSCKKEKGVENSYTAYKAAVDLCADRIELDVRLTQDKKVIINHNPSVKIGRKKYRINKTKYQVLKSLRYSNEDQISDIESVLNKFLDKIELNIELKGSDPLLVDKLMDILYQYQKHHPGVDIYKKVIISSFNSNLLKRAYDLDKRIKLAYLFLNTVFISKLKKRILNITKKYNIGILHPNFRLVTPSFVKWARSHKFKIYSWSGFKEEDVIKKRKKLWTAIKISKIDGHCTNYIEDFRTFLQER